MKNTLLTFSVLFLVFSCNKIEESVSRTITSAKDEAQQKATEMVQETVNEQLNKVVSAETVKFETIFPNSNGLLLENEVGKKVAFPNGTPFYILKYKTAEMDLLLKTLVEQPTSDETRSKKDFEKIDGTNIVEKLTFFAKFLPANTIDMSFLDDLKNDKNIEYFKIKRFPNASTVIYNPKNGMVYQFVEVKK
ncbi:hypothetical protein [Chryseobacterium koreense]|uniref:Lipoprotein n=1 Tax=Chryseobacterium koreense CCUG 49689 TaxID=1304281 RepID=A0A0J7LQ76_9FLAO|nr:hypothetical protein [Chryseobacterium koreense]KMQ71210.1 hypothetical protein ACM44_08530 [Chryseobacterium koreense CCUG 49689]MBB5332658.1 hypothetical protein [Chryseobacterium koreense]